ncbi:hypothetical protein MVEN_01671800 [Mycena venus]|uniref:NAD(P)-binding protein n=1 Tax=Mycena venus TaxID=2733690 RepID=A0A8H6XPH1_9AGAR|nr:hypothetical protein MVEN_01671800 [Mycena venus]
MSPLIAFIIGAGKNIGEHTAAALKAQGYQVALGSRKPAIDQVKKDGYFPVAVNAQSPESIKAAFALVNKDFGPPNVTPWFNTVLASAAAFAAPPVPEDPLTLSVEDFKQQTDVGLGVYAAAQEALSGFRSETHKGALKTFIVTGNPLPWMPVNDLAWLGLNIEKVMEWRLIEILSRAYSKEGSRLVGETGEAVDPLSAFFTSGPQHAQVYLDLITRKDQADWEYRFTLDGKKWTK